jgi:hypothetical protein
MSPTPADGGSTADPSGRAGPEGDGAAAVDRTDQDARGSGTSGRRTGETPSERHTRQISEMLMETRVAAVGIQVVIGFLLAVPFQADLEGLQESAYLVAIMAGILATALLLAPSILHRALLHRGQAQWLVAVGTRLLLLGAAATSVALVSAALLVGDRVLDSWGRFVPAGWTVVVLGGLWFVLPLARRARLDARDGD